MAVILGLGFALWTFWIVRERFYWYAVFPGVVAALMAVSILGMTTNRELPPEDADELPPGATPVRTDRNDERVLASIDLAAGGAGDISARFEPTGQVGCAFAFLAAMRDGRFEAGLSFADDRWLLCRVQAYLWNNQATFGSDIDVLADIAESLTRQRNQAEEWASFVAVEASQFQQVWGPLNPANYGAASRRRRLSGDHELVVLAPVGNTGGYFVTTATALLDALTFVVHFEGGRWLVANHVGTAPPAPGWPPIWWSTQDPVVEALPEP